MLFLKLQEVSQFLKDSHETLGKRKMTAKEPKVTIKLLPQSKNILFLQG